ncbi:MAG: hypothetical protein HZA50_17415 [Planctomycetes bacterium]|nr:hypothetical protein [Planctomycetota bacterium]
MTTRRLWATPNSKAEPDLGLPAVFQGRSEHIHHPGDKYLEIFLVSRHVADVGDGRAGVIMSRGDHHVGAGESVAILNFSANLVYLRPADADGIERYYPQA